MQGTNFKAKFRELTNDIHLVNDYEFTNNYESLSNFVLISFEQKNLLLSRKGRCSSPSNSVKRQPGRVEAVAQIYARPRPPLFRRFPRSVQDDARDKSVGAGSRHRPWDKKGCEGRRVYLFQSHRRAFRRSLSPRRRQKLLPEAGKTWRREASEQPELATPTAHRRETSS